MLVNFKRNFFSPSGTLVQKGTQEYNGPEDQLPSDAVIVDRKGRLPVMSNTPKAGHGAKPVEEQILDMIPGAGVTHQIDTTPNARPPVLTQEEKEAKQKENDEAAAESNKAKAEASAEADKQLIADVQAALPAAEAAAERMSLANDPLSPFVAEATPPAKPKK